jgi:hypothetical protein
VLLKDSKGREFELLIVGYEFPLDKENWLLVDVRMKGPKGERRKRDPCLTVREARELAEWLDNLARTYSEMGIGPSMPDLVEPNLKILVLKTSPSEVQLKVEFIFDAKSTPPIFDHVNLEIKRSDLELAVSDFRRELERYPSRDTE